MAVRSEVLISTIFSTIKIMEIILGLFLTTFAVALMMLASSFSTALVTCQNNELPGRLIVFNYLVTPNKTCYQFPFSGGSRQRPVPLWTVTSLLSVRPPPENGLISDSQARDDSRFMTGLDESLLADNVPGREQQRLKWRLAKALKKAGPSHVPVYISMTGQTLKVVALSSDIEETLLPALQNEMLNALIKSFVRVMPPDDLLEFLSEPLILMVLQILTSPAGSDGGDDEGDRWHHPDGEQDDVLNLRLMEQAFPLTEEQIHLRDSYRALAQKRALLRLLRRRLQQAIDKGHRVLGLRLRDRVMVVMVNRDSLNALTNVHPSTPLPSGFKTLLVAGLLDSTQELEEHERPPNPGQQENLAYSLCLETIPGLVYTGLKSRQAALLRQQIPADPMLEEWILQIKSLFSGFCHAQPSVQQAARESQGTLGARVNRRSESSTDSSQDSGAKDRRTVRKRKINQRDGDDPAPEPQVHTLNKSGCYLCDNGPCKKRKCSENIRKSDSSAKKSSAKKSSAKKSSAKKSSAKKAAPKTAKAFTAEA